MTPHLNLKWIILMLYFRDKAMASIVTYRKSVQILTAELGFINVATPGSFVNKTIYIDVHVKPLLYGNNNYVTE